MLGKLLAVLVMLVAMSVAPKAANDASSAPGDAAGKVKTSALEYARDGTPIWTGPPNCDDLKDEEQRKCCLLTMKALSEHHEYRLSSKGVILRADDTSPTTCPTGYKPSATQCANHPAWCEPEQQGAVVPGGTRGVTVTGVTGTTTYEHRGVDLFVTGINGQPVTQPAPSAEERGKQYAAKIRDYLHLPSEWFKCTTTADCGLAAMSCNTSLAVNRAHVVDVEQAVCHQDDCNMAACLKSAPDTSRAICDKGECATVIH